MACEKTYVFLRICGEEAHASHVRAGAGMYRCGPQSTPTCSTCAAPDVARDERNLETRRLRAAAPRVQHMLACRVRVCRRGVQAWRAPLPLWLKTPQPCSLWLPPAAGTR